MRVALAVLAAALLASGAAGQLPAGTTLPATTYPADGMLRRWGLASRLACPVALLVLHTPLACGGS